MTPDPFGEILSHAARLFVRYAPPPIPRPFTFTWESTMPFTAKATPPPLGPGVASIELHYTPDGGAETVLTTTGDPLTFAVDGPISHFAVAVGTNGQKSDPTEPVHVDPAATIKPAKPGEFVVEFVEA